MARTEGGGPVESDPADPNVQRILDRNWVLLLALKRALDGRLPLTSISEEE